MNIFARLKQKNLIELWSGISIMAALVFMLFFYAPLELYFYNQSDFWFDVYDLLPQVVVMFIVGFALSSLLLVMIYCILPRFYRLVLPIFAIVLVSTYIQGNYLVDYLPVMDGSYINWDAYSIGRWHTIILWIVVTVLMAVAYKILHRDKFVKAVCGVSIGMILMFTITLVSILFLTSGYEKKLDACATIKNEYTFSEDKNFIIFLLDSVDSATMYQMMEENTEYKDIFEDFTYYVNTMGAYPLTRCAIPHILSGEWYENEKPYEEYTLDVYKNAELFEMLEADGYQLGMYDYDTPYLDESIFRFDNVMPQKSKVSSYLELAKLEIKLVGFRYAPFDLKRFCRIWSDSISGLMETDSEYVPFTLSNVEFYDRIVTSEVEIEKEKWFKFIHIEGAHTPFRYDKDLNVEYGGEYSGNIEACFTLTKGYLEKLKEAGVYDNSIIIVMADHGLDGDLGDVSTGRQNPILFVKGINERHTMEVSQAPISYVDLQDAFQQLLKDKESSEIFEWQEGDTRERRYIYYDHDANEYMYEYVSSEHAAEDAGMTATGREFVLKK